MNEPVIKHPDERVYVHIRFDKGKDSAELSGYYPLCKLVPLANLMAQCVESIMKNQLPKEAAPQTPEVEPPEVKPNAVETKWREFRETIEIPAPPGEEKPPGD